MDRRKFLVWSLVGAVPGWSASCSIGYFVGRAFPWLAENIDYAILGILALSVIPLVFEWWRHRQRRRRRPPPTPTVEGGATGAVRDLERSSTSGAYGVQVGLGQHRRAPRGRRRPAGSRPAGDRSIAQTTTSTVAPASRSARVASRTAPPVVMTSSTSVTRAAGHVGALGQLAGAVVLGLLAHEQRGQSGARAEHGHDRDAAHLEAARAGSVSLGQQGAPSAPPPGPAAPGRPRTGTCRSTPRHLPRPQRELAGQAAAGVDVAGEVGSSAGGHSGPRGSRAQRPRLRW